MIHKGCTCENSFPIPFPKEEIVSVCIAYKQNGVIKLEKKTEDCTFKNEKLYVSLSQEDTLKFDDNSIVKIQIKMKLKNGAVTKSNVMETYTDEVLSDGVI